MARILIVGAYDRVDTRAEANLILQCMAMELGREVIRQGHVLRGACRNAVDAHVAEAAAAEARARQLEPCSVIRSWVAGDTDPSHSEGEQINSRMGDWSHVPRGLVFPEPVQEADVVVFLGGGDGTHYAASWARLANKPLVPVAYFGMAAAEIFEDEMSDFDRRYAARIGLEDFQILNRRLPCRRSDSLDSISKAVESYAPNVLALAGRLVVPNDVFVIMSFADKGDLKDAYNTITQVCSDQNFEASRADDHEDPTRRIVPAIHDSIRRSAFVIADVSELSPNVYYELGYAKALGKVVLLTARKGTQLPFDVFDIPAILWDCQDTLKNKLYSTIGRLAREKFGRSTLVPGRSPMAAQVAR